jgi:hypothetical protein
VRSPVALILLIFSLLGQPAMAGPSAHSESASAKRVALVIGNSTYQKVPTLRNPVSDATAIGALLKNAGFDVVEIRQNLANVELRRTLNNFYDSAKTADIAVVYYAGHGIEVDGSNYIIPVDAVLERDRDVYDEALSLDRILQSIEPARQLRLVLLDACRENPFSKSMRRSVAARGLSRGLARVDPDTPNTLIAFAAKAGATADDGNGAHSPFTTSLLKHLTVPGLDLRKALGLVRDEVMSATANRQEPFVFGSLGGADVTLVPMPVNLTPTAPVSAAEIRADYEFAERVGTTEAWDYFLEAHVNGFYADLAKAQRNKLAARTSAAMANAAPAKGADPAQPADQANIKVATLNSQMPAPSQDSPGGARVLPPAVIAPGREPTSKEALDWDKVKDSADQSSLQSFIKRYPNSPLAINAQQRLDVLKRAADEREAKARADREAAAKAAEEARVQAEQKHAELTAAKKREDDERRAKAAEAEQKAKAAAAEKKAAEAKQRAEEAEKAKAAAEEARIQAEQKKAEAAAAKKRDDDERRSKAAEAEQNAKAAAAEKKIAEEKRKAEEAERIKAAAELEALRAASEQQARQAEAERKKAELASAREATCKQEQTRFDELSAKGSEGSGLEDIKGFSKTVTCDRLRPQLDVLVAKFNAEAAKRAAAMPNSPELIRAAQTQLARVGCFSGKIDGVLGTANTGLERYTAAKGSSSVPAAVTADVVAGLTGETSRVCPLQCKSGETVKGEVCVANVEPVAPASASRRNKPAQRQATRAPAREAQPAPQPHARQQALGVGTGSRTMIGVGF